MSGPVFVTSKVGAAMLACSFHSMTAPGFDEALVAGLDLLGETLVRLGREELAQVFTYVSGDLHGDRVPLLVKGMVGPFMDSGAARAVVLAGGSFRVHDLLYDLLAPALGQGSMVEQVLTYGGRTVLAMASSVALVPDGGELLREVWQGYYEDAPQLERMLAKLRSMHDVPHSAPRHVGSLL